VTAAPRGPGRPGLWRHRDFLLLWAGQSISELGSAVTMLALPLTAVVALGASTFDVGLLAAATTVPFLLIALPAGLAVDRMAKRGLMIGCDAARMLIIGSVPIAAGLGRLTLFQLYAVAVASGVLTVFFDVAYQSFTPALIDRDQLPDGNGKLAATQAFAQVAGPGLGGGLFGLLRAGALAADAVSFAVSTISLLLIRAREPASRPAAPAAGAAKPRLRTELFAGLSFIVRHPVLRRIAACTATANLFTAMAISIEIIFLVRVLHVRPAYAGLLVAAAGLGGVAAGIASGRLSRWIGSARIIWVSMLVFDAPGLLLPLAEPGWRLALVVAGGAAMTFSAVLYNIAQLSYRQAICPPGLLGRLNAAIRWIVWGTLPLGSIIGGTLGSVLGVRPTMWIGMAGSWAASLWVLFSPLRRMRDVPGPGDDSGADRSCGPAPASPPSPGRRRGPGAARPAVQEP
jgi:Na+/melibiose symporter-like transporter